VAPTVRVLVPGDEPALEVFLLAYADSSLFLRSNMRVTGLVDRGAPLEATYVGAFDGARLIAVAAHCWNGDVLLQAPVALAEVATRAVRASGRRVHGLIGPWSQVRQARAALELDDQPTQFVSEDELFALALGALVVPSLLRAPGVECRPVRDDDLDLVTAWRVDYRVELMNAIHDADLRRRAREEVERVHRDGSAWLLEVDGVPVAFSAFNARLPDVVQIGGVWTPPALRGRGYGRAVVAGSLLAARVLGVTRSILFTGRDNVAARRAYLALGYRSISDYGLVVFASQAATPAA
jgi:GNAT superfamily N-acetyltransferase